MTSTEVAKPEASRFYRPELDALRAVAAFMVVFHHVLPNQESDWLRFLRGRRSLARVLTAITDTGAAGVDLFFVLSGFLITTLLLREREKTGTIDIKAFYMRRVLRIWPLYFVVIGVCTVAAVPRLSIGQAAALAAFCANIVLRVSSLPTAATPMWSVNVEEQFYLLWPLAVRNATHRRIALYAALALCVSWVSRAYCVQHAVMRERIWNFTFTRLDGLAIGVLLAVYLWNRSWSPKPWQRALGFVGGFSGMALTVGLTQLLHGSAHAIYAYTLVALCCACVLLSVYGVKSRWLTTGALPWLGTLSFGIYLWQLFVWTWVASAAEKLPHSPLRPIIAVIATLLATTLLAWGSYRLIERPFLRLKDRFVRVASGANRS